MSPIKKTGALALIAALAVPAGAQAHRGYDDDHKRDRQATSDDHRSHSRDDKSHKHGSKQSRVKYQAFIAKGTFVSFTEPSLVVNVTQANRHAKRWCKSQTTSTTTTESKTKTLPSEQTFTLTDATKVRFDKRITDTNADGKVDFADLAQGTAYRVYVFGKIAKATKSKKARAATTPETTEPSATAPVVKKVYVKLAKQQTAEPTEQKTEDKTQS